MLALNNPDLEPLWAEIGNHLEANAELDNIAPAPRLHHPVLMCDFLSWVKISPF